MPLSFNRFLGPRYYLESLGIDGVNYSPQQADLLIVCGPVTKKIFPIIKNIYDQMACPKWVMALGSEAISGSMYPDHILQKDWMSTIPVEVNVPGLPPTPESIIQGILHIRERIEKNVRDKN